MTSSSSSTSRRSTIAAVLALAMTLAPSVARAHFTLQGSREAVAFPSDNRRYFPLGMRPNADCLQFSKSPSPVPLTPGTSATLRFDIGNQARHVGPCTAQLIDASTGAVVADLGQENDCVNKNDAVTIQVPATATCNECVVKVKVTATHLGADRPEFYDSCLDVSIQGGSSSDIGAGGSGASIVDAPPAEAMPAPAPSAVDSTPAAPTPSAQPLAPEAPTRRRRRRRAGWAQRQQRV